MDVSDVESSQFECNEDTDSFKLDDGTAYDERVLMSAAARQQEQ